MITRSRIRLASAALSVAVGLALAMSAAASAAPAALSPAALSPAAASAVTPDVNSFWTYEDLNQNPAAGTLNYPCSQGLQYPVGYVLSEVQSVANNCEYRVYLQYANGNSNCVSPHVSRNVVDISFKFPDAVKIGNSTAACPS